MPILPNLKLGTRFTAVLLLFFLISIGVSGAALYNSMRTIAEESVSSNGLLLLHSMNAVRTYTSGQVNPLLAPVMATQDRFIPESVPAFSARTVFGKLRADQPYQDFAYKEASTNPTAPQNRADDWETQVLLRFRADRNLQSESGFRTLNGQLVFYNARPMVVDDPACLVCHSTPQAAPQAMVQRYGPLNGFGWQLNTVIAAQIVYVPAVEVYQRSWNTWLTVMLVSVLSFAIVLLAMNLVLRRVVIRPVSQMAELAARISNDEVDEEAPKSLAGITQRSDELGQMAKVFQRMAQEVYQREQSLKQQLQELRIEIDEVKKARQVAELVESDSFQDLRARAIKLREQHQSRTGASSGIRAEHTRVTTSDRAENAAEPAQQPEIRKTTGEEVPAAAIQSAADVPQRQSQDQHVADSGSVSRDDPPLQDPPPPPDLPLATADAQPEEPAPAHYQALQQQLAGVSTFNGISPLDILSLPDKVQAPVRKMLKTALTPAELGADLDLTEDLARQIAELLVAKGILERVEQPDTTPIRYRVHLARVHPRNVPPGL